MSRPTDSDFIVITHLKLFINDEWTEVETCICGQKIFELPEYKVVVVPFTAGEQCNCDDGEEIATLFSAG